MGADGTEQRGDIAAALVYAVDEGADVLTPEPRLSPGLALEPDDEPPDEEKPEPAPWRTPRRREPGNVRAHRRAAPCRAHRSVRDEMPKPATADLGTRARSGVDPEGPRRAWSPDPESLGWKSLSLAGPLGCCRTENELRDSLAFGPSPAP